MRVVANGVGVEVDVQVGALDALAITQAQRAAQLRGWGQVPGARFWFQYSLMALSKCQVRRISMTSNSRASAGVNAG